MYVDSDTCGSNEVQAGMDSCVWGWGVPPYPSLPLHVLVKLPFCKPHTTNHVLYKYTDKKENQIFLIYKEIQNGAVAKSYMTNGLQ
jgi:hypothetical protein